MLLYTDGTAEYIISYNPVVIETFNTAFNVEGRPIPIGAACENAREYYEAALKGSEAFSEKVKENEDEMAWINLVAHRGRI